MHCAHLIAVWFLSWLTYGILTCFFFYRYRLDKIQNRIIRIITHSKYNAQTKPLFKALDLLTISDLFNLNCLKFVYKFKNKKLPLYFLDFECVPRSEIHHHDTRYAHLIDSETTRTVMAEKCMRHHLANIINETPRIIMEKINSHSINGFIFFTKHCYLERYR